MDLIAFGKRIKELRLEKSLTAVQVGFPIGVSDSTIINWENAKRMPLAENIYKLAKFFGVSSDYLLGLED